MVEPALCPETGAALVPTRATKNTAERTVTRHHAPSRVRVVINASCRTKVLGLRALGRCASFRVSGHETNPGCEHGTVQRLLARAIVRAARKNLAATGGVSRTALPGGL